MKYFHPLAGGPADKVAVLLPQGHQGKKSERPERITKLICSRTWLYPAFPGQNLRENRGALLPLEHVLDIDLFAWLRKYHAAFDEVLQLTDIARKIIGKQCIHRSPR